MDAYNAYSVVAAAFVVEPHTEKYVVVVVAVAAAVGLLVAVVVVEEYAWNVLVHSAS